MPTATKFDSKFEERLYGLLNSDCEYHPEGCLLDYKIERKYEPDFVYTNGTHIWFIEAKGRFRDRLEMKKYLAVRDSLRSNERLAFILQNPKANNPGATRRKDGTRQSISEWLDKHGFKWFTVDNLPREWRK
jgi:hypothetical protein